MNNELKRYLNKILFPVNYTCNSCGKEIFNNEYFCDSCNKILPIIDDNRCLYCGRKTPYKVSSCNSCNGKNFYFTFARSPFEYNEPISTLIKNFKYNKNKYLCEIFVKYLTQIYYSEMMLSDVILYVPMSEQRLNERGFNHAEMLAKELSTEIGLDVIDDAIIKIKETEHQANLTSKERRKNLLKSFKVDKNLVKDKNILLVDDVLTTGATADTISKLLIDAGAISVKVLTIASVQL